VSVVEEEWEREQAQVQYYNSLDQIHTSPIANNTSHWDSWHLQHHIAVACDQLANSSLSAAC
jgi:hypothetical protein